MLRFARNDRLWVLLVIASEAKQSLSNLKTLHELSIIFLNQNFSKVLFFCKLLHLYRLDRTEDDAYGAGDALFRIDTGNPVL